MKWLFPRFRARLRSDDGNEKSSCLAEVHQRAFDGDLAALRVLSTEQLAQTCAGGLTPLHWLALFTILRALEPFELRTGGQGVPR